MHLPGVKAFEKRRDVLMAYEDDVGTAIRQGYQTDLDEQSVIMTQIALSELTFLHMVAFSGSFNQNSHVESVPQ